MSSHLRRRPRRMPRVESVLARDFHNAVVPGRCWCGSPATEAHHAIYEQELRRRGEGRWNPRNALGLCHDCHERHHNRSQPLPLAALKDRNVEYAYELLGAYAYDYLTRRYTGEDWRVRLEQAA